MCNWYPSEAALVVSLRVLVPHFDTPCNRRNLRRRRDSSVSIVTCYELDGRGSIRGRGEGFFSSQHSDRLWGVPSLLSSAYW
jgi:hypothetical protein